LFYQSNLTGASSGVGAAIATAFAREGAKVHLVCSPGAEDELKKIEANCKSMGSSKCECHSCDLSKGEDCAKLCDKLAGAGIDVLVNNAGIFGPAGEEQGPLKGNVDEWHKVIHTNLNAPMCLTRQLAPKMVDKVIFVFLTLFAPCIATVLFLKCYLSFYLCIFTGSWPHYQHWRCRGFSVWSPSCCVRGVKGRFAWFLHGVLRSVA
jgi:hypothetical protein